jgi:hypothetical protein
MHFSGSKVEAVQSSTSTGLLEEIIPSAGVCLNAARHQNAGAAGLGWRYRVLNSRKFATPLTRCRRPMIHRDIGNRPW